MLATFKGAAIRAASIAMVNDHQPDPPSPASQAVAAAAALLRKPDATLEDVKAAALLLLERAP